MFFFHLARRCTLERNSPFFLGGGGGVTAVPLWVKTNRPLYKKRILYGTIFWGSVNRKIHFCIEKKGSKTKERMKEEEIEKGDCGPPTRKVFCLKFCRDLNQAYLITSPMRVKHVSRIRHRTMRMVRCVTYLRTHWWSTTNSSWFQAEETLEKREDQEEKPQKTCAMFVMGTMSNPDSVYVTRWCIRLTCLTLVCEVIRYRLVQVRQNLKKKNLKCTKWGLVLIASLYPEFNGSHFGLPPSSIHQMTGLGGKMVSTMTYLQKSHNLNLFCVYWHNLLRRTTRFVIGMVELPKNLRNLGHSSRPRYRFIFTDLHVDFTFFYFFFNSCLNFVQITKSNSIRKILTK